MPVDGRRSWRAGSPSSRRSTWFAEELGEGDRSWILNGLRGVGKTVLLNELLGQVTDRGWIAAKVEASASASLPIALSQALVRAMRSVTGHHPAPGLRRLLGVFKASATSIRGAS